MKTARTLCLIKPDAVKHGDIGNIIADLEYEFKVVGIKFLQWTRHEAENFYAEHRGRPFFDGLVEFMSSGPLVAVALEGPDVVRRYRSLMGATDPQKADEGTLRFRYGTEIPANAVHGSDSDDSAARELSLLFPGIQYY